jgi:tetratricopeptide (TPR) repeat protein/transcriptional regulator with XRE-family HTH domain
MMFDTASDSFGTLLRRFRKRQHFTQQQLAAALDLHRNTIGRWEEGSFLPESRTLIFELARFLHLTELETRHLLEASLLIPTPIWSVPSARNPFFTGRQEVLEHLHRHLAPQKHGLPQAVALYGLGGIGKTQLALEYAYRFGLEYRAIFWIGAETLEHIHASLLAIAHRLNLPERLEADQTRMVAAVQSWLETRNEWLLIWDNMEDQELFRRFVPSLRHGSILITTRQHALGPLATGIDLAPMPVEEGMLLLLRRARLLDETTPEELTTARPQDITVARALVGALGGLPLALDQAGAYIEETRCGLPAFLALFEQAPLRLLQERGAPSEHPTSVVTTFTLAFERLQREHPAAADLLTACCFLAPEEIPEEVVSSSEVRGVEDWPQTCSEPLVLHEQARMLLAYGLIQRHPERKTLVVHRLVQAVLREQIPREEQAAWRRRMLRALNSAFPDVSHEVWETCERLVPHVLACVTELANHEAEEAVLVDLLRKTADYLRERARYEQAEPLYQRALHISEQASDAQPLFIARLLQNILLLYRGQGKFKQAEALGERILHLREQVLDPMHVEVAASLSNLASLYLEQGRYEQAEPLYQRTLAIFEQAYGPEHPLVARPLNNLALLYTEQGRYEQAEPLYQRSLSLREQALEPGDPLVGQSLNNLARLYVERGRYEQAEALYQRTLSIWELAWGTDHPELTEPLNNLARLYAEQGNYRQAELLYKRALSLRKQTSGAEHPQIACSLSGLANLAQKRGEYEQAEALYQQTLRMREHIWGEYHPETAQTLHDLALFREQQGDAREALALAERALNIRTRSLGETHPKTMLTRTYCMRLSHRSKPMPR